MSLAALSRRLLTVSASEQLGAYLVLHVEGRARHTRDTLHRRGDRFWLVAIR